MCGIPCASFTACVVCSAVEEEADAKVSVLFEEEFEPCSCCFNLKSYNKFTANY